MRTLCAMSAISVALLVLYRLIVQGEDWVGQEWLNMLVILASFVVGVYGFFVLFGDLMNWIHP